MGAVAVGPQLKVVQGEVINLHLSRSTIASVKTIPFSGFDCLRPNYDHFDFIFPFSKIDDFLSRSFHVLD